MEPIIELARKRGVYDNGDSVRLDEAMRTGNVSEIEALYKVATEAFQDEEIDDRAYAMNLYEVRGDIKINQDQTVPRFDCVAVLTMDRANRDRANAIYGDADLFVPKPTIATVPEFLTGDVDSEIGNAFGKGRESYMNAFRSLYADVPSIVEKVVDEFGR